MRDWVKLRPVRVRRLAFKNILHVCGICNPAQNRLLRLELRCVPRIKLVPSTTSKILLCYSCFLIFFRLMLLLLHLLLQHHVVLHPLLQFLHHGVVNLLQLLLLHSIRAAASSAKVAAVLLPECDWCPESDLPPRLLLDAQELCCPVQVYYSREIVDKVWIFWVWLYLHSVIVKHPEQERVVIFLLLVVHIENIIRFTLAIWNLNTHRAKRSFLPARRVVGEELLDVRLVQVEPGWPLRPWSEPLDDMLDVDVLRVRLRKVYAAVLQLLLHCRNPTAANSRGGINAHDVALLLLVSLLHFVRHPTDKTISHPDAAAAALKHRFVFPPVLDRTAAVAVVIAGKRGNWLHHVNVAA